MMKRYVVSYSATVCCGGVLADTPASSSSHEMSSSLSHPLRYRVSLCSNSSVHHLMTEPVAQSLDIMVRSSVRLIHLPRGHWFQSPSISASISTLRPFRLEPPKMARQWIHC